MKRTSLIPAIAAFGLAVLAGGCSSSNPDSATQGSLKLAMGASTTAVGTPVQAATTSGEMGDDALSHLSAATITISSVEARTVDGTWAVVDTGLPADVDILAILSSGNAVTLPADLIPEGTYNAIQIVITKVNLTLLDGTQIAITPPGTGWTVQIPVDFTVTAGQATTVTINLRCDHSFKLINGEFEFEPEVEVEGVEHD